MIANASHLRQRCESPDPSRPDPTRPDPFISTYGCLFVKNPNHPNPNRLGSRRANRRNELDLVK